MAHARTTPTVTLDEIRGRATIDVWSDRQPPEPNAAGVFGIGRATAYAMAARGDIPTIRLGARIVVPVPALLRMLGEDPHLIGTQAETAGQTSCSHGPSPAPLTDRGA